MTDDLHTVLDDMDDWIAEGGTEEAGSVSEVNVLAWRAALAAALERTDRLERVSRSALDAYLLRSSPAASPALPSGRAAASVRKQQMQRLAAAMAALEEELDANVSE